jgi:hypothetical protein
MQRFVQSAGELILMRFPSAINRYNYPFCDFKGGQFSHFKIWQLENLDSLKVLAARSSGLPRLVSSPKAG